MSASCCYDRFGWAKRSYSTREAAEEAALKTKRRGGDELEPYRCEQNPTRWHLRNRSRYAQKYEAEGTHA